MMQKSIGRVVLAGDIGKGEQGVVYDSPSVEEHCNPRRNLGGMVGQALDPNRRAIRVGSRPGRVPALVAPLAGQLCCYGARSALALGWNF
jgi:hypothetical protein